MGVCIHHHRYMVRIKGLQSYGFNWRWLDITYRLDILHHLYGNPIVPFRANLFLGCAFGDPIIAAWCFCRRAFRVSIVSPERDATKHSEPGETVNGALRAISDEKECSARRLFGGETQTKPLAEQLNEARLPRNCGQGDGRFARELAGIWFCRKIKV